MIVRPDINVAAAQAHLLRDRSIQFQLGPGPQPPPVWLLELLRLAAPVFRSLGWVLWAALALAVAAILYLIARRLIGTSRKTVRPAGPDLRGEDRPGAAKAAALLSEADRLAGLGAFGEACRVLLWRSVEDIRRRRPRALPRSATAREIAASPDLGPAARTCFAEMAAVVEQFAFAARPVDEEAWARCRRAYTAFALPWDPA